MEVDHISGNVTLTDWEHVTPFIQHLCGGEYQLVTKKAHKIKSYAERTGVDFRDALIEKQAIELIKTNKDIQWIKNCGIIPQSSKAKRRTQIVNIIKEGGRV